MNDRASLPDIVFPATGTSSLPHPAFTATPSNLYGRRGRDMRPAGL